MRTPLGDKSGKSPSTRKAGDQAPPTVRAFWHTKKLRISFRRPPCNEYCRCSVARPIPQGHRRGFCAIHSTDARKKPTEFPTEPRVPRWGLETLTAYLYLHSSPVAPARRPYLYIQPTHTRTYFIEVHKPTYVPIRAAAPKACAPHPTTTP